MLQQRTKWLIFLALLAVAIAFRVSVAHRLANDTPDDGRVYSQLARNMLEQHVYADSTEAPFSPVYIRTPGYPLFLAFLYSLFGHTNNSAVRIAQALVDSATCVLVALFAVVMQADDEQFTVTFVVAMALAAANPFTTIYTATLLPEVPATFLAVATCLVGMLALRSQHRKRSLLLWSLTGLLAGAGVLVRPDSGLFAAAVGLILIVASSLKLRQLWRHAIVASVVCFLSFAIVLLPWTIRNWRVFHVFQPLAPATAAMPDEFVPRGYSRWLRTWLDDQRYVDRLWWRLDNSPILINEIPAKAFDSAEERNRIAALLEKYNHPADTSANEDTSGAGGTETQSSNNSTNNDGKNPESDDEDSEPEEAAEPDSSSESAEMTPEIDAGFGQIAAERISRAPIRYYLRMPIKRAAALWLNTHSDYYPFAGDLFPLDDLDYDVHQHIWLPIFASLVGLYSVIGLLGGGVLWLSRSLYARMGLLLLITIFITRFALFSLTESLESRYVVELFPFLAALGGIAVARIMRRPISAGP